MIDLKLNIKQGEDKIVSIPVLNDMEIPIDLSSAIDVTAVVMVGNVAQAKFSTDNTKTGYGIIVVDTINTHIAKIQLKREVTKNFPLGLVSFAMVCKVPDAEAGYQTIEIQGKIGSMVVGYMKEEILKTA